MPKRGLSPQRRRELEREAHAAADAMADSFDRWLASPVQLCEACPHCKLIVIVTPSGERVELKHQHPICEPWRFAFYLFGGDGLDLCRVQVGNA